MATNKDAIISRRISPTVCLFCLWSSLLIFFVSANAQAGNEQLYGTWRFISHTSQVVETGEITRYPWGKAPRGFQNYAPDGRVITIIVWEPRPKPASPTRITDQERIELFKTMTANAGTYTFDGKTLTVTHDVHGDELTSVPMAVNVKLEGRRMIHSFRPNQVDGKNVGSVMTWEKVD